MKRISLLGAVLAACAGTALAAGEPYGSTYQPHAGPPTLIRHATVLDGTGRRLDDADVMMRDGKIVSVGAGLDATGATVVDAKGRWVTPGIIDVHSHLGVYASPGVNATQDGNERRIRSPRAYGPSTRCGRRIPGSRLHSKAA